MGRSDLAENAREQLLKGIPVAQRRVELAGVSTSVLEGGDGPPVVLLHGPVGHAGHWFRVLPALAKSHRVVAPDLPGQGDSELTGDALDADEVLVWLGELIEDTCPSPPTLVGFTLGGAVAARFAIAHGNARPTRAREHARPDGLRAPGGVRARPKRVPGGTERRDTRGAVAILRVRPQTSAPRWVSAGSSSARTTSTRALTGRAGQSRESHGAVRPPPDRARGARGDRGAENASWGRHDRATPLGIAEAASERFGWPLEVIENPGMSRRSNSRRRSSEF